MTQPRLTVDQHATALAANLPSGRIWLNKWKGGSVLRRLLNGLAPTFRRMDEALERFVDQSYPPETVNFLAEWEAALGIPDDCLPVANTIAERQRNVEIKLLILAGIQTEPEFAALGQLFGLDIAVHSGIDHVPVSDGGFGRFLPELLVPSDFTDVLEARNTMVVVETFPPDIIFPWPFPLQFATGGQNSLRCLLRTLAPAHLAVIFVEKP